MSFNIRVLHASCGSENGQIHQPLRINSGLWVELVVSFSGAKIGVANLILVEKVDIANGKRVAHGRVSHFKETIGVLTIETQPIGTQEHGKVHKTHY